MRQQNYIFQSGPNNLNDNDKIKIYIRDLLNSNILIIFFSLNVCFSRHQIAETFSMSTIIIVKPCRHNVFK